jgi:hypothetical protein
MKGPTRFSQILDILSEEMPLGRGDDQVPQRQAESLYTWCRDQLDAATDKAEVAKDLQAVLANLTTCGYEDTVRGADYVRTVCDARRANRGRIGDLRKLIAEYMHCSMRLEDPECFIRREKLDLILYEYPGSLYHALHDQWTDPRAQDVISLMLRRLPRYERIRPAAAEAPRGSKPRAPR